MFCAMPSNKQGTLLGGAVKSAQRLPPSLLLAALPFNIACKPILLSDPARAVLHSARSAGEISEVLLSGHRRNLVQGNIPPLMPTCHYLLLLEIRKSQDLAKDFGGTASKAEKTICKSKKCKLYIET